MFNRLKSLLHRIKKINKSIDVYKHDSIIQSLPTVAYLNNAKKLIEEEKYEQAEELLKQSLDISNNDANVYRYLGKISEHRKDYSLAIEYYNQCLKLAPLDKEIWLRLGYVKLQLNMVNESIVALERAEKITPTNPDIYFNWGIALMKLRKYALARDKFAKASKLNKYFFPAILLAAVMDKKLNDYELAEEKLEFLIQVIPTDGSYYEYADLMYIKERYNDAEIYAKKAIELNREMLPAYVLLGNIYSEQKKVSEFENIYEQALDWKLESALLRSQWGLAYMKVFEFQKAKNQFLLALKLDEKCKDAVNTLLLIKAYEKDFSGLEDCKNIDNSFILESLGLEKLNQEDFKGAIEYFKKSLRKEKKQTFNYYNLAQAYYKMGDNTKVRENFDKFIELNSSYVKGFIDYAKYLIEQNDYEEAQRKLRRAQKFQENNIDLLNLLFYCLYKLALKNNYEYNKKEARKIAQELINLGKFEYYKELEELTNTGT